MKRKFTLVLMITMYLLTNPFLFSQCQSTWQDSLAPSFDLYLTASAISGTPPYTFQFFVQNSGGMPITPSYQSSAGDTVIIAASDMFNSWGCVFIRLCMIDGNGCSTCAVDTLMSDTLYTNAITCYSAFSYNESPLGSGDVGIFFGSAPPDFLGQTIIQWVNGNGSSQITPVFNGVVFIDYTAASYNASGYDVPVCASTFFPETGVSCYYCDTIHLAPQTVLGLSSFDQNSNIKIYPNPTTDLITIQSSGNISEFKLIDANGKVVVSNYTPGNLHQMDVSFLSKGIYTLVINTSDGAIYKKVVKQ